MLLHLCQPTESGMEEQGRAKPNGGVMYLRIDEQIFSLSFFLSCVETQEEAKKALKTFEVVGTKRNVK